MEELFPVFIDYYFKYCIERKDLKTTLSGSTKRNFLFEIFGAGG